jgi:hypothetical protein
MIARFTKYFSSILHSIAFQCCEKNVGFIPEAELRDFDPDSVVCSSGFLTFRLQRSRNPPLLCVASFHLGFLQLHLAALHFQRLTELEKMRTQKAMLYRCFVEPASAEKAERHEGEPTIALNVSLIFVTSCITSMQRQQRRRFRAWRCFRTKKPVVSIDPDCRCDASVYCSFSTLSPDDVYNSYDEYMVFGAATQCGVIMSRTPAPKGKYTCFT